MSNSEGFEHGATDYGPLTKEQAENIADLAARRAEERLYARVGRNGVTRSIYAIGAGLCALAVYLSHWVHITVPK